MSVFGQGGRLESLGGPGCVCCGSQHTQDCACQSRWCSAARHTIWCADQFVGDVADVVWSMAGCIVHRNSRCILQKIAAKADRKPSRIHTQTPKSTGICRLSVQNCACIAIHRKCSYMKCECKHTMTQYYAFPVDASRKCTVTSRAAFSLEVDVTARQWSKLAMVASAQAHAE